MAELGAHPLELAGMRDLAWPTEAQTLEFIEHLCWAHSWYKHLPPTGEAEFVVFLAPDAGAGYENHERLHYTWKTTAEYRKRFGHLDYAWRIPGDTAWDRDSARGVAPSPELLAIAGLQLGPACSTDGNAVEAIASLYADDPALPAGYRELCRLQALSEVAYAELSEVEREAVVDSNDSMGPDQLVMLSSPSCTRYLEAKRQVWACYDELHEPELAKIRDAVARLRAAIGPGPGPGRGDR
jgi:hypothetical protein